MSKILEGIRTAWLRVRTVNCNCLSKIALKASITRPRLDNVALASGRCCPSIRTVALRLHVITIIRLWASDPKGWCPDGWTGARNFHIWCLIVRTMKTNIQTVELCMHHLPYGGHHSDGITHRPNDFSRLPITVSWGRNSSTCQTMNGVGTV
jgi:hypothetical protein